MLHPENATKDKKSSLSHKNMTLHSGYFLYEKKTYERLIRIADIIIKAEYTINLSMDAFDTTTAIIILKNASRRLIHANNFMFSLAIIAAKKGIPSIPTMNETNE